jgi:2-amino-4-hydroxy-6-hydroxymethyldihydropteridine diphosphokinase
MTVGKLSSVYETDPVGNEHQPLFLNAVLSARADLEPPELLRLVKGIERDLGRMETFRNAPRAIDIDILFYGDSVIRTEELTVPHPGVAERAFVLVPLSEIAPRMVHPLSRMTIADLLAGVSGLNGVRLAGSLDASRALE